MDPLAELAALEAADSFVARHIAPDTADIAAMLVQRGAEVNVKDFDGLSPLDLVRGVDDKIAHMLYERKEIGRAHV